MRANVGDRIVIKGHRVGAAERDCEVVGVEHSDGSPPYMVRWEDSDHLTLFFPGPDARVEHSERARGKRTKR